MKWGLCCAVLAGVLLPAAHAASFDCTKDQRPVEKLICGHPKLNAADDRMVAAYRLELAKLPVVDIGLLRADHVQWLAWVQETCQVPEAEQPSASQRKASAVAEVVACMLPLYADRTKELRGLIVERDGVRFLTRTQYLAEPDEQVKEHPDWPAFGTLQASWPVALADTPEWAAWNRAAEAAAYALAAEDTWSIGKKAAKETDWTPDLAAQADIEITVRVRRVEHGRVTSAVAMTTDGHPSAHPSETAETMTWMLQDKRRLQPGDVFQAGDAWKQTVAEACWNTIHTGDKRSYVYPEVAGPDSKSMQAVISNVSNWTLEHDGLHVSYPEYAVSPRYAGMDDTVIPWTALQPLLAKGFVAP